MNEKFDEAFINQLFAELIDAMEHANATMALAVGDVIGHQPLAAALRTRLSNAKAAESHTTRDALLQTALQALEAQRAKPGPQR